MENQELPNISYSNYQKVFKSQNIGFARPSQDECDLCLEFREHQKIHEQDEGAQECSVCAAAKNHHNMAESARREYQTDKSKSETNKSHPEGKKQIIMAADMQKILQLPKITLKSQYFISRLTVFNETFCDLGGDLDMCVLWYEGESGRCAADVASAYYKVMSSLSDFDSFVIWTDNCSTQNKNWVLFTSLWLTVNQTGGPNSLEVKYLKKGHTYET